MNYIKYKKKDGTISEGQFVDEYHSDVNLQDKNISEIIDLNCKPNIEQIIMYKNFIQDMSFVSNLTYLNNLVRWLRLWNLFVGCFGKIGRLPECKK
jgi:hypothetical protein